MQRLMNIHRRFTHPRFVRTLFTSSGGGSATEKQEKLAYNIIRIGAAYGALNTMYECQLPVSRRTGLNYLISDFLQDMNGKDYKPSLLSPCQIYMMIHNMAFYGFSSLCLYYVWPIFPIFAGGMWAFSDIESDFNPFYLTKKQIDVEETKNI